MWLIVYSNDHAPLTVRPIYSSSKLRTVQMMIFSLVVMIGLDKCCITSAYLQWLCHSGEQIVARGPLVLFTRQCAFADVITNVTKQNMNVIACQTSPCKCKFCISSIESDVYNKKKIQMFVVNMTFISSWEVKKCIFHSCLRHSWNIHFFHFTWWNKSHIHSKHLNILYVL